MEQTTETPTELCRIKVSELQGKLAKKATENPEHRFTICMTCSHGNR